MGQDEAAPSQKSAEEKVVQVKTGPSRCLAEPGQRGTCERQGGWQYPAEQTDRAGVLWGSSSEQVVPRQPRAAGSRCGSRI